MYPRLLVRAFVCLFVCSNGCLSGSGEWMRRVEWSGGIFLPPFFRVFFPSFFLSFFVPLVSLVSLLYSFFSSLPNSRIYIP